MPGRTDYFIGKDPQNWKTGIPSYSRVEYEDVYPGVNLVYYGNQRRLEYDFVVAPGTDPKVIQLRVDGARSVSLDPQGNLLCRVPGGQIELEKPLVYQDVNGVRKEVAGNYVLRGDSKIAFVVGGYDSTRPLVLDPVLSYSTYLSGTLGNETSSLALGIAVDSNGDAFVVGTTMSTDFPTSAGAFKGGPPTTTPAVFVSEFNPGGTSLLYSTYLGGSGGEFGFGIGLDSSGNAYVTGESLSTDFPTTATALIPSPLASNPNGTAFLSKINPSANGANSLAYSTYFGGTNGDFGNSVAADSNQVAYFGGFTISAAGGLGSGGFTTKNGFQAALSDPVDGNAFLTAINTTMPAASALIYSTYLGGDGVNAANLGFAEEVFGVATDGSGNAFVTGATSSDNFPTTASALQGALPAGNTRGAAFVTKFNTAAAGNASLVYSTYLGGKTFDFGNGISLGPNHVTYTTGTTDSTNFPATTGNISPRIGHWRRLYLSDRHHFEWKRFSHLLDASGWHGRQHCIRYCSRHREWVRVCGWRHKFTGFSSNCRCFSIQTCHRSDGRCICCQGQSEQEWHGSDKLALLHLFRRERSRGRITGHGLRNRH